MRPIDLVQTELKSWNEFTQRAKSVLGVFRASLNAYGKSTVVQEETDRRSNVSTIKYLCTMGRVRD